MARFLTTIPVNIGFVNLGNVQAYPTGGTGPTAYGPTTYFGSDPKPAVAGDSINTPINLELQKIATESLRKGLIAYDLRKGWRGPITNLNYKKNLSPKKKK